MVRQSVLKRIEKLEKSSCQDHLVIIPSWGDYVYIDGKPIAREDYKSKPGKTITLTWGDDTPKNPGKTKK